MSALDVHLTAQYVLCNHMMQIICTCTVIKVTKLHASVFNEVHWYDYILMTALHVISDNHFHYCIDE